MAYMDKERATSKEYAAKSEAIRKQNAATFKARRNASLAIHAGFERTIGKY